MRAPCREWDRVLRQDIPSLINAMLDPSDPASRCVRVPHSPGSSPQTRSRRSNGITYDCNLEPLRELKTVTIDIRHGAPGKLTAGRREFALRPRQVTYWSRKPTQAGEMGPELELQVSSSMRGLHAWKAPMPSTVIATSRRPNGAYQPPVTSCSTPNSKGPKHATA